MVIISIFFHKAILKNEKIVYICLECLKDFEEFRKKIKYKEYLASNIKNEESEKNRKIIEEALKEFQPKPDFKFSIEEKKEKKIDTQVRCLIALANASKEIKKLIGD